MSGALAGRLRKRQRHVGRWARKAGTTAYRLYDRDIPEHPLVVERYGDDAVAWLYRRTRDEEMADALAWEARVGEEIQDGLDLPAERVHLKRRGRQRGLQSQYEREARWHETRVVVEGGLRFEVNLSDFLDTGLFLHHRKTRAWIREAAEGLRFLNLFSYTGAFTVHARAGGAATSTSVDLSRTYHRWAERNLALNGLPTDDPAHRLEAKDCLAWLDGARARQVRYDLIFVDPPTFSNSTRMGPSSFAVDRDHPALLAACAELLAPGGTLWFSTNARRFQLDEAAVGALFPEVDERTEPSRPRDFERRLPHRLWRMRRADA